MEFKNVYELLNNNNYDPHVLRSGDFILLPHQVIPKYYLYANDDVNKLILHYSVGSGKSAAAAYALLHNLIIYRMFKFNSQFMSSFSVFMQKNQMTQNVIVVGAWQTQAQIETELLRPEFNIISTEQTNELNRLLNSTIDTLREEGESKRQKLIKDIEKDVRFIGYQSFFNLVFPDVQAEKYNQNIDALIQEYNRGQLQPSQEFLKAYHDSIIIIDEMQRLYSNDGLNTYGFAVAIISKLAKSLRIKMLFLSGTMINSSLGELTDIINIISDDNAFISRNDLCRQDIVLGDIPIWRLKEEKYNNCIDVFKRNFMYYNQSELVGNEKPELVSLKKLDSPFTIKDQTINIYTSESISRSYEAIIYPPKKYLPIEIHIGNKLISPTDAMQSMILYEVEVEGLQADKYNEYLQNNIQNTSLNEHESETVTLIHDAYIPPQKEWNKYGIYEESGGLLWGKFLDISNIRKFSALGYELFNICINNSFNNEKTIIYHNKINSFGIRQYAAILQYNGFIRYNDSPNERSLCKNCHHTYKDHGMTLENKLKNKVCSKFQPIYYELLTGNLTQQDRDNVTNRVYNSPNNLYGDLISVMFVSDVAYSGVSFFNTQNIVILSRIPNISKWKQIYARIIRTKSHALLPEDKRYAKVYTFAIKLPNELKKYPKLGDYTFGERYYKLRIILNEDIEKFIHDLSNKCISKQLLYEPEKYTIKESENKILNELYNEDLRDEIKFIVKRIMIDKGTFIWNKDVFLKRLLDPSLNTTYLNISKVPEDILFNLIVKEKLAIPFKYDRNDTVYVELLRESNNYSEPTIKLPTFSFNAFTSIDLHKSNVNNLIKLLYTEKSFSSKINILASILRLTNRKFEILKDKEIFWSIMYEIGNEYYPDDETNFIRNHCRKNRNSSLFTGCYYGQYVIFKDGTYKMINYSFPIVNPLKGLPYVFKISCLNITESSPFYLHVNVVRVSKNENIKDRRKLNKGIVCMSMNVSELYSYFKDIDTKLHKKKYCTELMFSICEKQNSSDEKFVYTPFEK